MANLIFRESVYKDWSITITKDGSPLDMGQFDEIKFIMSQSENVIIEDNATIVGDATDGVITYDFSGTQLSKEGIYQCYFLFNNSGISKLSYPDSGFITLKIASDYK